MEKTTLGLTGLVSALLALPATGAGAAAPQPALPPAQSFAELLDPIPNAVERLKLVDAQEIAGDGRLIMAQYDLHHHHHHHRHHHHHAHVVLVPPHRRPVIHRVVHPVHRAVHAIHRIVRPRPRIVVSRHHHHHHHAVLVLQPRHHHHHHHHHHDDGDQ